MQPMGCLRTTRNSSYPHPYEHPKRVMCTPRLPQQSCCLPPTEYCVTSSAVFDASIVTLGAQRALWKRVKLEARQPRVGRIRARAARSIAKLKRVSSTTGVYTPTRRIHATPTKDRSLHRVFGSLRIHEHAHARV
jgi:hypothetical protein